MIKNQIPIFYHKDQLLFKPKHEWAFGRRINHPERSKRAEMILKALEAQSKDFELIIPKRVTEDELKKTHSELLIKLYKTAEKIAKDNTYYPSIFPKRHQAVASPDNLLHAGFFCFDSGTPLNAFTWLAASWSAACALEGAQFIGQKKGNLVYSLCRPPGHHATKDLFGGYCYFNNAAIAAKHLRQKGEIALVDIDFHHGNGTQDLFYKDNKVLFISIHADPREYYPFFSGFESERGEGLGLDYNYNFPLPKKTDSQAYLNVIDKKVLPLIKKYNADYLILSAGFDTYKLDPIGGFSLETSDYTAIGERFGKCKLPTLVLQEGGYHTEDLGRNVIALLEGLKRTLPA